VCCDDILWIKVVDLTSLEALSRTDAVMLRERLTTLSTSLNEISENLSKSRQREIDLEQSLLTVMQSNGSGRNVDEIVINENGDVSNQTVRMVLEHSKARVQDLEAELQSTKASMNDLIIEIEAIAEEGVKAREHSAKVLRQVGESQGMQSGVLEENMRLNNELTQLQAQNKEIKEKYVT
jgi:uncharacterized phage infection (PIP) family protein YhgE